MAVTISWASFSVSGKLAVVFSVRSSESRKFSHPERRISIADAMNNIFFIISSVN